MKVYLDSFSGAAAGLRKGYRTIAHVLSVLAKHPRISTWDMSENRWLWSLIVEMKRDGLIVELDEPYPWLKFELTEAGRTAMTPSASPHGLAKSAARSQSDRTQG